MPVYQSGWYEFCIGMSKHSNMHLSFHGAARTVTGSKHLLTLANGDKILLDCGMFQGMGIQTPGLNAHFGFDPAGISCVILSHAHIDHSGLLPKLVKEGFRGPVYCSQATRELTEILLYDSAQIQHYHHDGSDPLYNSDDVAATLCQFRDLPLDTCCDIHKGVSVTLTGAGHVVGSAAINLLVNENGKDTRILYTGDIGRYRSALMQGPSPCPQADIIIMESTYGNCLHDIHGNAVDKLCEAINETCIKNGGKLIIPAFSVGRTQELLYALNQLELEKRLPALPYYVDSPLAHKATTVTCSHLSYFNERLQKILEIDDNPFDFAGLQYIDDPARSQQVSASHEPCVILASSGTADAGRVIHHIKACASDQRNTILMAGFCTPKTLGGKLLRGIRRVQIHDERIHVRAKIGKLEGMSAHGDQDDLLRFLQCQEPSHVKNIFLVHGEYPVQIAFAEKLARHGFTNVVIPSAHRRVELGQAGRGRRVRKAA
jgi:metallo-beta-lactamase family protein